MKTKPISTVHTVNVIELVGGDVAQIFSFPDNKAGNKKAEALFSQLFQENCGDYYKENGITDALETCLEDGVCDQGDWKAFITHSS